jgi:uncharacterized protein (TIGR02996 family)
MTPEHAFLQAIRESPGDDDLRLIFGDWLEENEDPRGELVRLSVRLAQLIERDPARRELYRQIFVLRERDEALWLGPMAGKVRSWRVVRGLLALTVDGDNLAHFMTAREGERVLRWVGELEPAGDPAVVLRLLGRDQLPLLTGLRFDPRQLGAEGTRSLVKSRCLAGLRTLSIRNNHLGAAEARALANSAALASLVELDLENNAIGTEGLKLLAESPWLSSVQVLNLRNNSPLISSLTGKLTGTPIGAEAIRALMTSPTFAGLRVLRLWRNQLGPEGSAVLADASRLRDLIDLDLSHNELGEDGAAVLASGSRLVGLRGLDVAENDLGNAGVQSLARSPHLRELVSLRLARNNITDAGVHPLAAADLTGLRDLDLSYNPLGDAGALSLSLSPHLDGLRCLSLAGTHIGKAGRDALRERFGSCLRW